MDKKNGYAGRVANVGSQRIEAPAQKAAPAQKGNVRYTGDDLRNGTGGNKSKRK